MSTGFLIQSRLLRNVVSSISSPVPDLLAEASLNTFHLASVRVDLGAEWCIIKMHMNMNPYPALRSEHIRFRISGSELHLVLTIVTNKDIEHQESFLADP